MSAFGAALSTMGAGLFQMGPQMAQDQISAIEAQAEEAKQARAEMFKVTAMAMDQYTNQIQISQNQEKIDLLRNEDTRKQADFESSQAAAKAGTWEWKKIENRTATQNQLTGEIESVETQPTYGWQNSVSMEFVPYNPGQTSPDGQAAPVIGSGETLTFESEAAVKKAIKDQLTARFADQPDKLKEYTSASNINRLFQQGIQANPPLFVIEKPTKSSATKTEAGKVTESKTVTTANKRFIEEAVTPELAAAGAAVNDERVAQANVTGGLGAFAEQAKATNAALVAEQNAAAPTVTGADAGLITAPLTGQSPAYGQAEVAGQVMGQPTASVTAPIMRGSQPTDSATTSEPVVSSVIGAGDVPTQKEVYEYDAEESAAFIDELIAGMQAANIPKETILEELKKIMTGLSKDAAGANSVFADVLARKYTALLVPPSGA